MVCKNKVSTSKAEEDKKTGARVMTYTTTRRCSNNPEALEEEEINENKEKLYIEEWEEMVYPDTPPKQSPKMVEIVVMDKRTRQKYKKLVPLWSLDRIPDPKMIEDALMPDKQEEIEIKETLERWKKLIE